MQFDIMDNQKKKSQKNILQTEQSKNMMLSTVYGIYVVLGMSLNYDEVKLNTNVPPFLDLTSCVTYVEENKDDIFKSASIAFGEYKIREMGCVEVINRKFVPIHTFDLTS